MSVCVCVCACMRACMCVRAYCICTYFVRVPGRCHATEIVVVAVVT